MIYDKNENIKKYPQIPHSVADFILNLTEDIPTGRHEIAKTCYANVDEYETKFAKDCRLEAHKKYIDIQILLKGKEELDYTNIEDLQVSHAYDEKRDVMFFVAPEQKLNRVILEQGYFAMLYPHEAHEPQMNYGEEPCRVKKVVVKIEY